MKNFRVKKSFSLTQDEVEAWKAHPITKLLNESINEFNSSNEENLFVAVQHDSEGKGVFHFACIE